MVAVSLVHVAPVSALAERFARWIERVAAEAIAARGRFSIAVPGGSVAEWFLPALAQAEIAWACVEIFTCDERCVPLDDPATNFGALRHLLLDHLSTVGPQVHRMRGEDHDSASAAAAAEAEMRAVLGPMATLDVVLLGVGEDGHVASLFPRHPALEETARLIVVEPASPKPPPRRLTMTLPVIAAAREVVVAAFGAGKAPAMHEALGDPRSPLPVARVFRAAARVTAYVDPEAAGSGTIPPVSGESAL